MQLRELSSAGILAGKRVLLRAELNVPVAGGKVFDEFRLLKSLETMRFLSKAGARTTIVAHLGREGGSLAPIAEILAQELPVAFVPEIAGERARAAAREIANGGFLLLENLRSDSREEKNDPQFAKALASFGELFVQDAFGASHRTHASIVGVPARLPSFAGLLLAKEVAELSHALTPPSPSLLIIGGAKFETKGPLIEKFLAVYDIVFVGGAIANDLFKAQGLAMGKSLISSERYDFSNILKNPKLMLPSDVVVEGGSAVTVKSPAQVLPHEGVYDVGPDTIAKLADVIQSVKFILWNGPMGNYEHGFVKQTEALARAVAGSGAYSVVGGGDTVAAIAKLNLLERFGFVSTGGGAMLEFLEKGTLPGIEALRAA